MTTFAPSRAKASEMALPIPVSPPVTIATLSISFIEIRVRLLPLAKRGNANRSRNAPQDRDRHSGVPHEFAPFDGGIGHVAQFGKRVAALAIAVIQRHFYKLSWMQRLPIRRLGDLFATTETGRDDYRIGGSSAHGRKQAALADRH